jgi:hypothetical protein
MSAPAKPTDNADTRKCKDGLFLQDGRWQTRKEIMVRARYGNDANATSRAIEAMKAGWHGQERGR